MTSVEVLAAARLIRGLPEKVGGYAGLPIVANTLETIAGRLAKVEKADAEVAELAAYGGIAGAEAGWNALRQHNPKVDRSSGVHGPEGEVHSFADLSHKLKLGYAAFAFGVLNPGAKPGSAVPQEPYQFKVGDRVRFDRDANLGMWVSEDLLDIVTIASIYGSGKFAEVIDSNGLGQGVHICSLTLVTEPRTWPTISQIPDGATFLSTGEPRSDFRATDPSTDYWKKDGDGARRVAQTFYHVGASAFFLCGPFIEVAIPEPAEPRTWNKLADIPIGITVTDEDGDNVKHDGQRWLWTDTGGCQGESMDCEGPFTEVIA